MNRIDKTFQALKKKQQTAFIGFLTAGDPDLNTTKECIFEMEKNGCDLIEIGIPFSDPCAEGPIIQQASLRALQNDISCDAIMDMVKEVRKSLQLPLIYMLYYNQIFKYGCERFINACAACGIDALIICDLPFEHQDELTSIAHKKGIYLISLVTPASGKRKKMITQQAKGFLYCVTSMGVTGVREQFHMDLKAFIEELNSYGSIPKAFGFGISTPKQIKELKQYADGIIVGSAIVREIAKLSTGENTIQDVGAFVYTLSKACHEDGNI